MTTAMNNEWRPEPVVTADQLKAMANENARRYHLACIDDDLATAVRKRRRVTLPAAWRDLADRIDELLDRRLELTA